MKILPRITIFFIEVSVLGSKENSRDEEVPPFAPLLVRPIRQGIFDHPRISVTDNILLIFYISYSSLLPLTSYSAFLCIFWFSVFLIPHSSIMVTVEVDPWTGPLNSRIFLLNSLKKTYYPCHLSPRFSWPWSFSKPFS